MTKSKTLVELLVAELPNDGDFGDYIKGVETGLKRAIEIARTHQDTEMQLRESMQVWIDHHNKRADDAEAEVQRLRDVIARCRDAMKTCRLFAGCEREYDEMAIEEALAECNTVLEDKK